MVGELQRVEGMNCYKLSDSYVSGTRYRLYISNNEPAYVYVIGSDLTGLVGKVFPPTDKISAALTYKSNHIAIPDERYYIQMDDTKGKDYMCVLYSKDALNINSLISRMQAVNGSFYKKIKEALGTKMVPAEDAYFARKEMTFQAQSKHTVVPLVVEITHR